MRRKIFTSAFSNTFFKKRSIHTHLPMSPNAFPKVIEHKLNFVDKSLFIKDIIEDKGVQVSVITCPPQFGKTFNLSMLRHFLASEVDGKSTQDLFNHLKITQAGNEYQSHQGRYPVIFISFKGIKDDTYKMTYSNLCKLISRVYREHQSVLFNSRFDRYEKKAFETILEEKGQEVDIQDSLCYLTRLLYLHHRVKPWLLIDDYDTPIMASYGDDDHKPFINLMQNLLGSALKSNSYLNRAVVTGVMTTPQLFIHANNLVVYPYNSSHYSKHFGFTEEEVQDFLRKKGLEQQSKEIQNYYCGYHAGKTIVYNPWSIVNYIANNGQLSPYWINTTHPSWISDLLLRSSTSFKSRFELLFRENRIECIIEQPLFLDNLFKGESTLWYLLLNTGYLTSVSHQWTNQGPSHVLEIPNQEVRNFYQQIIHRWHNEPSIDSFKEQLQSIVLLIKASKVSEADRKCSLLIQTLEPLTSSVELKEPIHHLLCEAYVIKANFLSRMGVYEDEHQQALTLYDKALKLAPDYEPAKQGKENLLIQRGESSKVKIVGTLYHESFFFNPRPHTAWVDELKSIKLLWSQNKGSEAVKKCDALIEEIEISPAFSEIKTKDILCEAYIFKGDFLRLTAALEEQAQEAFNYYYKALAISPNNQAAEEGIENLRIIRGESTKMIVEEPDPETSYFKF